MCVKRMSSCSCLGRFSRFAIPITDKIKQQKGRGHGQQNFKGTRQESSSWNGHALFMCFFF